MSAHREPLVQKILRCSLTSKWDFFTHLCDFLSDVVGSVFDFRRYDGRLRRRRGVSLLLSRLGEVESDQRDLVDGAIFVDVRVRGRTEQAGLHVIKGAWRCRRNTER